MNIGIVGLPQVGKKTVFELLTGQAAATAPSKGSIRHAIAAVRDPRIDKLVGMYNPKRMRYAEFEMALPPDVTPNASRTAEWMDPLRNVDALMQVVRDFDSPTVFHIEGSVDAARDLELVEMEFLLADMELVEKRLKRMEKEKAKKDAAERQREEAVLKRCLECLEAEKALRLLTFSSEELKQIRSLQFFTLKPQIVVFNTGEDLDGAQERLAGVCAQLRSQGASLVFLSAAIEAEMSELEPDERDAFMADLGLSEPAAHRLSRAAHQSLGLISFFTVGPDEVRAWPIPAGLSAPEAAGKIHSDLQRGFIRAETTAYDDLIQAGSEKAAKEANKVHVNGKDYIVKDGDILNIRFNV